MRQVRIKTLPNYFGQKQHGYLPQYSVTNVSGHPRMRGDDWHSYKQGSQERIHATWDGAFSFLASRFNFNYVHLYLAFQGMLPYYHMDARQQAIEHTKAA